MPPSTRSTRRTTLGAVSMNRNRESMPGTFSSTSNNLNQQNGKMKKKSTRSRMSMAPRVGGGGEGMTTYNNGSSSNQTVSMNNGNSNSTKANIENNQSGLLPTKKSSGASAQPTTPSRRKSMGHALHQPHHHSVTSARTDPRPINEKSFQNTCIRTILQYLLASGYNHPISSKILSRPSGKDFHLIVTFLLRRIDSTFRIDTAAMKFEEEVAMAFKGLGYPFPISKTALVAVGSIHTWPALLAALTWLIELLSCKEVMSKDGEEENLKDQLEEESDNKENTQPLENLDMIHIQTEKRFFRYLAQSYEAFLSSNDDQYDILEEKFLDDFERDNMKIEKEIERVTDGNADIVEEIDYLARNSLTLPELEKKREDLCTDLEKFHSLVKKFEEHKAALQQKVNEREKEYRLTHDEVSKIKEEVTKLKEQIQSQEFSIEDVKKMEQERSRMKETMERSGQNKQKYQKHVWEQEMELKKQMEDLDDCVKNYNEIAKKSLNEEFFYVSVNADAVDDGDQSKFLGVDVKNSVIPMLHKLNDDYINKIEMTKKRNMEVSGKLEIHKKSISDLLDEVTAREEQNNKVETCLKQEDEELEAKLKSTQLQIDSIIEKTNSLRDPLALEASIERFQTQSAQLAGRRLQLRNENAERKEAVQKEINDALGVIADHKDYIQTKLADLEEYANSRLLTVDVEFITGPDLL